MSAAGMKLFGRPAFLVDGQECSLTPQHLALLGLLYGHEREGLGRGEVTTLLWAGGADDSVRRRLSQLLYSLVSRCGESVLLRAGDTLARPPHMPSDLRDFSEHLEQGRYDEAAALVGLGFLDVLPVVPTTEYQDWLDRRRLSLRESLRKAAARQWSAAEAQGQWGPRSLAAAQALRLLDPRNEMAVRNVMWAQALCSSPAEAIATYESFVETLGPGQGAADETRTLLQRIRSLARQKRGSAPTLRSPRSEPRMYGREAEVARLRPLLAEPRADHFETVAIVGEAGFGKTRLLQESLAAAALQGRLVLEARLAELEKDVALNALTEALSTREVAEALTRVEDPWRSVVLTFLPEAAQVAGAPIEVPEIQRSSLHRRLLESLRQLFDALAANHSIVVVLDDAHWIDDSSLAALEYIRRRWRTGSATLVLTYRPEHVQRGSKLHAFLAEAECQELALGPLDEASQKQLTAEFGGADLGAEAARWIQDLAKGNPLFLIELIRQCLSGDLVLPPSGPDEINLPSSIQQLFDRRLAGLTPDDRRTLEALAVWGRVASLTDLLALTGLDEEAIVASLERLDAAGLVRWGEEGTELWHELLRQSVLQGAVGARRQLLHRRAGRLLMDVRPQPRGEIALHCYRAGDRTTAFMFARAAAAAAERGGAVSEAIGLLRVAYNTAEPPIERSAVRLRLGELLLQRCDHEEARRLLATVRSLSSAGDPNEHDRWAQLRLLEAESRSGLDGEVAEALEHLWSSAAQRADSRLMVEIAEQTLRHHERRGRFAANAALALERVDRCLSSDDQHTLCTALRLGVIRVFLNDIERADAHTAKSLELARTTKARPEVMLATLAARIAFLAMVTRLNAAEGRELCEAGLSLAKRLGDIPRTFSITSNAGAHALEAGDVDRARALFDQCSSIISGAVLFPERQRLLINYGELYVEQGNLPAARLSFSSALQLAPSPEDECGTAARVGLALCDALEGALRSARRGRDSIADRFSGPLTPLLDSGLFAKLEFVLARRTGGPLAAIQCAERHTAALDAQRPGRWISLTLDVLPLLRVHDPHEANKRVERGVQLAVALDLPERLRRFRAVVASRD